MAASNNGTDNGKVKEPQEGLARHEDGSDLWWRNMLENQHRADGRPNPRREHLLRCQMLL